MPARCKAIIAALEQAGFSNFAVDALVQESNQDLLRRTLVRLLARGVPTPELTRHLDETIITFPFSPIPFTVEEWHSFFQERCKQPGKSGVCKINKLDEDSFFGGLGFDSEIEARNPTVLLVRSEGAEKDLNKVTKRAEEQLRGCYASTKPRLIFEILARFWDGFNEINAGFVAVPIRAFGSPNKFPIIVRTHTGMLLALVNALPEKYSGFLAYCGTTPR